MTKQIILKTKRDLAEYYLNREFIEMDFSLIKEMQKAKLGTIKIIQPLDNYLSDFCSSYSEYDEKIDGFEDFKKYPEIKKEFDIYIKEEYSHFPKLNKVWKIDKTKGDSYLERVDELEYYNIGLMKFKDDYYLFITATYYSLDNYIMCWIPFFTKILQLIDEDCREDLKTIEVRRSKQAIFTGSEELTNYLTGETEEHGKEKTKELKTSDIAGMKNDPYFEEAIIKDELILLVDELNKNDFESLRIEY